MLRGIGHLPVPAPSCSLSISGVEGPGVAFHFRGGRAFAGTLKVTGNGSSKPFHPGAVSDSPANKVASPFKGPGLNPGPRRLLLQPGVMKDGKPLTHPVDKSMNLRGEV